MEAHKGMAGAEASRKTRQNFARRANILSSAGLYIFHVSGIDTSGIACTCPSTMSFCQQVRSKVGKIRNSQPRDHTNGHAPDLQTYTWLPAPIPIKRPVHRQNNDKWAIASIYCDLHARLQGTRTPNANVDAPAKGLFVETCQCEHCIL